VLPLAHMGADGTGKLYGAAVEPVHQGGFARAGRPHHGRGPPWRQIGFQSRQAGVVGCRHQVYGNAEGDRVHFTDEMFRILVKIGLWSE
jgi:hypothetical protein